jgi:hypothetical protein
MKTRPTSARFGREREREREIERSARLRWKPRDGEGLRLKNCSYRVEHVVFILEV